MSALHGFHPAVAAWFRTRFAAPTPAQEQAWPAIQAGRNVLVAAPTGSGKTLSAFLAALDELVREEIENELSRKFEDFKRASTENGLSVDEFDSFGPTRRTLRQFITACYELNGVVRDILLPDPDRA